MPLHDVSYHRYDGVRTGRSARIWALARFQLASLLKERRFLLLLGVSWVPAIIRGGQIYVAHQFPQTAPFLEVDPSLWRDFLAQQTRFLLVILVTLYVGSGSIATDLRSGALVIYLSKPLSRLDYLLGKCIPVLMALSAITMLPGVVLLLIHLSLAETWNILRQAPWLPVSIVAYSAWVSAYFCAIVLVVSSLSRSRRLAAVGFVLLALGSRALHGAASRLGIGEAPPYLSLIGSPLDAADLFFGGPTRTTTSFASLVVMALVMIVSVLIIDRRLRSSEVAS